ncbi:sensor histidine kinase [Clostridium rectalis]|uniref:sensor histidine kinase n=1 Tax=Clostridium rectalis TaxID=2040295 RepID=UPI0013DDCC66|nr:sensor histidine kinase [Clostridium rectalis]
MGTSPIGIKLDIFLKKQYTVYQNQLQKYISKQKEHLTFINQWVHQMKTPLSVIQLIIQDGDFNNLNNIKTEVEKLNEGLNTALYLARMDTFENDFHIEPIDLNSLIYEVINDLKRLFIRKRVYPKVELKNNHKINCDTKWLKFILKQFLTNSIKYSNRENSKIFISSYEKNNKIILQVCDEGIGIPKCDIKRIFEPFYTGENGRKFGESTGVGLYIVKEVCNKLNLKLQVQSEIGKGTCIKVLF